jgi:hypothetical protein
MHPQVCALFERVINAEGSDVDLDQVAAAAMEAVEGAVRDEVEAATVLSATQAALAKTLQDLQALDGESAAARVADITSALASTDTIATAAASVDGSSSKAPSPTVDAIQLLDSLTAGAAGAAGGAQGSAAAAGAALLQAVDAPSSSNGSGGQAAGAAAAAVPVAMASYDSASKAAEQAKKSQVDKAKAKLLKLGGAAVAIGLAYAFLQTAAGQVRPLQRCLFLEQKPQHGRHQQCMQLQPCFLSSWRCCSALPTTSRMCYNTHICWETTAKSNLCLTLQLF